VIGTRNRGLYLGLSGTALLLAATLFANRPVTPLGGDASPRIFSAYRADAVLRELMGAGLPHPIGSVDNARIRNVIVKRLSALGYTTELQTGLLCNDAGVCGTPTNVIARLGSGAQDVDAVLLSAHYDSVAAGPGASDDGAGVASVIEIARVLAGAPPTRQPIVLLLDDGEEAGLLGALLFTRDYRFARNIKAAVNLEARGTSGTSFMFETGNANAWAMKLYKGAVRRPTTNSFYYVGYQALPNDTDFTVFKAAHYQGFNFAYIGDVGRYHTPLDTWASANSSSIQQQGDNALSTLLALANAESLRPRNDASVFFDVFARRLVMWPTTMALPAGIVVLVVLLAAATILLRNGAVCARELLWGVLGTIGLLTSGTAITAGWVASLLLLNQLPPLNSGSWIAHPWPMNCAAAAIAFLAAGIVAALTARRAGFWGFWIAGTQACALLSTISALLVPGVSYLFLVPAMVASIAVLPSVCIVARGRTASGWSRDAAALGPLLAMFASVLPLLSVGYTALGSLAWPICTLLLCFGTATFLPALAVAGHRARVGLTALSALIAGAGMLLTLALPNYSAQWPQRLNFEYSLDADTGEANWLAITGASRLPPQIARTAFFGALPRPRFAGSPERAFYAAAPAMVMPPPELTLESTATDSTQAAHPSDSSMVRDATHYDLRVRSQRRAPEVCMVFAADARVREISVATTRGSRLAPLSRLPGGATLLDIVGLPPGGMQFGIDTTGKAPLQVLVFDRSYNFTAGRFLQQARPAEATSSQNGDLTVVYRTVSLDSSPQR
jgi:Peptidase family M28